MFGRSMERSRKGERNRGKNNVHINCKAILIVSYIKLKCILSSIYMHINAFGLFVHMKSVDHL